MTVGERIKELRIKLNMSQVDFADKINVSKQTLYKYENNIITNIPSDKIEAAAQVGNVSPAYLMGWGSSDSTFPSKPEQDIDLTIIQRERSKMSSKEKVKLMNILKANFDDYNWEEDDSGNIE